MIEKFREFCLFDGIDCMRKINEIIDFLNDFYELHKVNTNSIYIGHKDTENMIKKINELDERLSLESDHTNSMSVLLKDTRNKISEFMTAVDKRLSDLEECVVDDSETDPTITEIEDMQRFLDSLKNRKPLYQPDDFSIAISKRLDRLEEKAILKPDYDPNDVAFPHGYEIAKEGTFEWALIQMKNAKKVRRRNWKGVTWSIENDKIIQKKYYISGEFMHLSYLEEIDVFESLKNDWQVIE